MGRRKKLGDCLAEWQKSLEKEGIDIISSLPLPEDILRHVLSFLSTKDAIRTSVLSRRWRYLWTSISDINLEFSSFQNTEDFSNFERRVLTLHDASDIRRLRLKFSFWIDFARINRWISFATKRNVEVLDFNSGFIVMERDEEFSSSLFTCDSLVVLKISAGFILKAHLNTCLSNLKKLHLSKVTFSDELSTQHLFSGCPVLEDLAFGYCIWKHVNNITISIPSLRRLTLNQDSNNILKCFVKIYAVNLVHLECENDLTVDFDLCNISSLDCADVELVHDNLEGLDFRAYRFLSQICHVKSLTLRDESFMYMEKFTHNLPVFPHLTYLKAHKPQVLLIYLLQVTRKLEFLELPEGFGGHLSEYLLEDIFKVEVPSCFSTSLKKLCFWKFEAEKEVMELLGYVLKYATVLESLILYCSDDLSKDKKRFEAVSNQLNILPKGSEICVVELV